MLKKKKVARPRSHSWEGVGQGYKLRPSGSKSHNCNHAQHSVTAEAIGKIPGELFAEDSMLQYYFFSCYMFVIL